MVVFMYGMRLYFLVFLIIKCTHVYRGPFQRISYAEYARNSKSYIIKQLEDKCTITDFEKMIWKWDPNK